MRHPGTTPILRLAPAVRWEPCSGFHALSDGDADTCARCGWTPDEHDDVRVELLQAS